MWWVGRVFNIFVVNDGRRFLKWAILRVNVVHPTIQHQFEHHLLRFRLLQHTGPDCDSTYWHFPSVAGHWVPAKRQENYSEWKFYTTKCSQKRRELFTHIYSRYNSSYWKSTISMRKGKVIIDVLLSFSYSIKNQIYIYLSIHTCRWLIFSRRRTSAWLRGSSLCFSLHRFTLRSKTSTCFKIRRINLSYS